MKKKKCKKKRSKICKVFENAQKCEKKCCIFGPLHIQPIPPFKKKACSDPSIKRGQCNHATRTVLHHLRQWIHRAVHRSGGGCSAGQAGLPPVATRCGKVAWGKAVGPGLPVHKAMHAHGPREKATCHTRDGLSSGFPTCA